MNRESLADRFVNYADALSVFPFVQAVAFSVALSEPDIRCSIAEIWGSIIIGNLLFMVILAIAIVIFRRSELRLRQGNSVDELVQTYLQRLYVGRLVLLVLSFVYSTFSVYSATLDPLCLA